MDIGITSARYATALLAFAAENDEETRVYQEMTTAVNAFRELPQLHTLLQNPALPTTQRKSLLEKACSEGEPSKTMQRFIELLLKNGRTDMMPFFAQSYIERYRKQKNFINSRLTVPVKLSSEATLRFKKMVEEVSGSHVEFQVEVDKDIEGGFILEYDTYRLDASVRTQFQRLHREMGK